MACYIIKLDIINPDLQYIYIIIVLQQRKITSLSRSHSVFNFGEIIDEPDLVCKLPISTLFYLFIHTFESWVHFS